MDKKTKTSMSVQCHYKYNNELYHFRMGEYRKTDDVLMVYQSRDVHVC